MAKSKKKYIVFNWKMNPDTVKEAKELYAKTKRIAGTVRGVTTIVCPPFPYLGVVSGSYKKSKVFSIGAQNVHEEERGAHTGEVSSRAIKSLGAQYVIVGHSERRACGETDEAINKKVRAVLEQKMSPIVCIGESERDESAGYLEFLKSQIANALRDVTLADLKNVLIAYEPVWAIGKSEDEAMQAHDIHQIVIFIEKTLRELYGTSSGSKVPVLYGGSVGPQNAADLMTHAEVDGLLIGHKSLVIDAVKTILKTV